MTRVQRHHKLHFEEGFRITLTFRERERKRERESKLSSSAPHSPLFFFYSHRAPQPRAMKRSKEDHAGAKEEDEDEERKIQLRKTKFFASENKNIASDSHLDLVALASNRSITPVFFDDLQQREGGGAATKKATTPASTDNQVQIVTSKPRVLILHTGGTLGMSSDSFEEETATVGVMEGIVGHGPSPKGAASNSVGVDNTMLSSPVMTSQGGAISGEAEQHGAYQRRVKKGTGGNYDTKLGPRSLLTDILSAVPELSAFAKLRVRVLFNKDSCQIVPSDWVFIAKALHEAREEYDAFVLVHGTDTLAYTASALSLILANFGKPIIVTGSQLPLAMPRSDARQNLIDSVSCATAGFVPPFISVNEVAVCFGGKLMRGNRVRKVSATIYSAFSSPSYPDLAHLGVGIDFNPQLLLNVKDKEYRPRFEINPNVIRISIIPGCDPNKAYGDLYERGVRGIVLEAFGVGNMPNDEFWIPWLRIQRKKGLAVYLSSQCERGTLHPELYMAGSFALEMGVKGGPMMSPECAVVKLMLSLANDDVDLTVPLAGEL
jgi:L-asparaginase